MTTKKFDPQNPKTVEELKELVRITKKKFGIIKSASSDLSINDIKKMVANINEFGPQKIADKIESLVAITKKSPKKLN